jgi:molybdate/tungstate transport system substrate-binding protein
MIKLMAVLTAMLAVVPTSSGSVSVAYAGSLVRVMEGPVAHELKRDSGLTFSGEAKGSKALAQLIRAGLRTPDVFISADPSLMRGLARRYVVFGAARMVVAYSPRSKEAHLFALAAHGRRSILQVLADPAVTVGRTDPQLDPKGERTVRALALLGKHYHNGSMAQAVLRKSTVFPEEDLAVRVESGEIDAGFFYSTEIPGRGLAAVELPADANLSDTITYAIAQMPNAAHPQAARTFVQFILNGAGKSELERAGLRYFAHPRIVGAP